MNWQSPHFTDGNVFQCWRCGLIWGALTLLYWLADKAEAIVCGKGDAVIVMSSEAIEVARRTVEAERLLRSSLS